MKIERADVIVWGVLLAILFGVATGILLDMKFTYTPISTGIIAFLSGFAALVAHLDYTRASGD